MHQASNERIYNHAGNTLFECCIFIPLIALVCSLYIHYGQLFTSTQTQSEVDILHAAMQQLKQRSLSTHKTYSINFNLKNNSYEYDGKLHKFPPNICFGTPPGAKGPPGSPRKTIESACSFRNHKIHFSTKGVISSGTIYIRDIDKKHCYALSNTVSTYATIKRYIFYNNRWQKQT